MSELTSGVRVGHVHLKVADLERSVAFYRDVLGFRVTQLYGKQAAFLAADDYHHHVGLNTWSSAGGSPPPANATGLFHVAFLYPDRRSLARAVKHVLEAGVQLDGAADHGVSEAVYFHDPDQNGIELYVDRDPTDWPRDAKGDVAMVTLPLDIADLLSDV